MKVLVTGGTGFLGRAIVSALTARGHAPVVFARRARSSGLPATCIDGDVRNGEALIEAARGCDAICHTAALVSHPAAGPVDVRRGQRRRARARARGRARARHLAHRLHVEFRRAATPGTTSPLAANDYQRTKAAAEARRRTGGRGRRAARASLPGRRLRARAAHRRQSRRRHDRRSPARHGCRRSSAAIASGRSPTSMTSPGRTSRRSSGTPPVRGTASAARTCRSAGCSRSSATSPAAASRATCRSGPPACWAACEELRTRTSAGRRG